MNKGILSRFSTTLFVVILCLSSLQVVDVRGQEEETNTEQVLVFLEDVVQIDMTKYEARLRVSDTNNWTGDTTRTTGQYILDSSGLGGTSIITISFTIVDNKLVGCFLYLTQGSPIFSEQQETNPIKTAERFLQRYQTFTNDPEVATMKNILETLNPKTNTTAIVENIKLELTFYPKDTVFRWSKNFNGADFSRLNLEFRNDQFFAFGDDRSYTKSGSIEVNISEEQAITLALQEASTYMFECDNDTVLELGFIEAFIKAELKVIPKGNQGDYYPIWIIDVPLDRMYGHISYFTIMLWADNGIIREVIPLGSGVGFMDPDQLIAGKLIETSNPTPSIEPTPTGQPPIRFYNPYLILFGSTLLLIALGILAYFKKYRK